jgi:uncharacterized membrane protein
VRLVPLDALRGLIMVLMALDHANGFVARRHPAGEFWGGAIPRYDSALEFLVRLVTHLCAPGFFFLMGTGITLYAASRFSRGVPATRVMRHFAVRGGLLVGINVFLENLLWLLGSTAAAAAVRGLELPVLVPPVPGGGGPPILVMGVLSGLGLGMVVSGLLVRVRTEALLALAVAALLATHLFMPPPTDVGVLYSPLARVLLVPGHTDWLLVVYPVVPWLAFVLPGMALGRALLRDGARTYPRALATGVVLLAVFFVVRGLGLPGNLRASDGSGWIALLNVTKYPPPFVFLALTLGANLVLLGVLARLDGPGEPPGWLRPILVFGRTPLFFYLAHLLLFALLGLAIGVEGTGVPAMLPLWVAGLVALYPACRWYDRFKRGTSPDSLWRLL